MANTDEILTQRNKVAAELSLAQQVTQLKEENAILKSGKLGRAVSSNTVLGLQDIPFVNNGRNYLPGFVDTTKPSKPKYQDVIKICRWFYENDPIAGTVINRMADMSITALRNRKKTKRMATEVAPEVLAFFDALVEELRPFLKTAALEYLIHGMAVPQYTTMKVMGNRLAEQLGRKRYTTVEKVWLRNPEFIELRKRPTGMDRQVFYKVPAEEIAFIQNKGTRADGTQDREAYQYLVDNFPEYIRLVQNGVSLFPLDTVTPIYRNVNSYDEYPIPFLQNALKALQHKEYLKTLDRSIASRAIEGIRHVKVGDKDFPADDSDITAVEQQVTQSSSTGERVFNLFTNHTVSIEWVLPPLDVLLNEAKYQEPNSDIFLGLGFPRILTVGETAKSNAADNKIASLGPKATLDDMRNAMIVWLKKLYKDLADINGFDKVPEPYFAPIATTDITALIQFAVDALNAGAISKDTVSQLYGSDFETEAGQIESEVEMNVLSPSERATQQAQDFQQQTTQQNQEFTMKQSEIAHQRNLETIKAQPKPAANNNNKPAAK